jgi:hypothetical protein
MVPICKCDTSDLADPRQNFPHASRADRRPTSVFSGQVAGDPCGVQPLAPQLQQPLISLYQLRLTRALATSVGAGVGTIAGGSAVPRSGAEGLPAREALHHPPRFCSPVARPRTVLRSGLARLHGKRLFATRTTHRTTGRPRRSVTVQAAVTALASRKVGRNYLLQLPTMGTGARDPLVHRVSEETGSRAVLPVPTSLTAPDRESLAAALAGALDLLPITDRHALDRAEAGRSLSDPVLPHLEWLVANLAGDLLRGPTPRVTTWSRAESTVAHRHVDRAGRKGGPTLLTGPLNGGLSHPDPLNPKCHNQKAVTLRIIGSFRKTQTTCDRYDSEQAHPKESGGDISPSPPQRMKDWHTQHPYSILHTIPSAAR